MSRVSAALVLASSLVALSALNAGVTLVHHYHWPLLVTEDWEQTRQERNLAHARLELGKLPDAHIEYRVEEASETYDQGAHYRLQYMLSPLILEQDPVKDRYVLVEFWTSRKVKELPGITLVEDLGQGLGLYRRP